jgi:hypothetical protein
MPWTAFADISPRTVLLTAGASVGATVVPWATVGVLFADTNWQDVCLELIKTVGIIAGLIFAAIAASRAQGAKAEAGAAASAATEAKSVVDTVHTKVDKAATEASHAKVAAKNAVQVAVESEKRAARGREVLAEVAEKTNGAHAALVAENADLRRRIEALLLEKTPPVVVEKIDHLAEAVELIVETSKSGTKLGKAARDPNARERATDQPN